MKKMKLTMDGKQEKGRREERFVCSVCSDFGSKKQQQNIGVDQSQKKH